MKTDLLFRIRDENEFFEEYVYQLNGEYPEYKFILWNTWGGDWVIFTNHPGILEFRVEEDMIDRILDKFNNFVLFSFHPMDESVSSMYSSYLRDKEYEKAF